MVRHSLSEGSSTGEHIWASPWNASKQLEAFTLGRLTDEIGFDGRHQRYVYNAAGEFTHLIERCGSVFGPGKVTHFERDVLGRLMAKRHLGR